MGIEWDRLCLPCSQITRKVETTVSRESHSDLEYREVGMKMRIQVQSPRRRRRKTESCRRKSCGGLGSGIWRRAGQGDRVREGKKSSRAASRVKAAGALGWKVGSWQGTSGQGVGVGLHFPNVRKVVQAWPVSSFSFSLDNHSSTPASLETIINIPNHIFHKPTVITICTSCRIRCSCCSCVYLMLLVSYFGANDATRAGN